MARQPFRPVDLAEALRPVAAPVDSFVHAQEPSRDASLQDLARSLSGLGGSLAGMVGEREAKAKEEDKIRANADFWQNTGKGAAQAIAEGLIPAQASPAYLKAYKQLEGEVAGGQLEQKFASAYDVWDGKTSTDPKAYDEFLGAFLKENMPSQDHDVLRGLLPKVDQLRANYLQRHIGDASKALQTGLTTALSAKGERVIDDANTAGLSSKGGTDYAGVFGRLEAIRADGLKIGANREQVDQKLIDTVTTAAITKRDPKLLDFLDRKVPGQDYTWSNTPYGRDQRQKTIETLETMGRKSIAEEHRRNTEEKAALREDVTRDTILAITKSPTAPLPEDLLARGEKLTPDFRVKVIRWRDAIGKAGQTSDNEGLLGLTGKILFEGAGTQAVLNAVDQGIIRSPEDLTKAFKLAQGMKTDGPALTAIFSSDQSKSIERSIRERTLRQNDKSTLLDPDGMSDTGLAAKADYRVALMAWRKANPEADAIEQQEAIDRIGASILKRLGTNDDGDRTYNREGVPGATPYPSRAPGDLESEKPKPIPAPRPPAISEMDPSAYGGVVPGATGEYGEPIAAGSAEAAPVTKAAPLTPAVPPQPATAPAPSPAQPARPASPVDPEAAAAAAWFNAEPPETRATLERRAAEEKKPLSLKMQEVYRMGIQRGLIPAQPSPAPTSTAPVPGKQSSVMKAPDGTPVETASTSEGGIGKAFREAIDPPATPDTVKMMGEAFERALAGTGKPQGGYSAATLRDDPKAARILDFVAGPESGGNYNAYFGNARSTKDLSAMTLDQVMAWSGSRGTASSATGRYQFMKATLRGLKTELGLSGSEAFTPALQDRMAVQLLNRRGYSEWQAGRITDAQFGNRLALEWASLPNITAQNGRPAGVSAYAGDGLNRSSASPASVLGALTGVFRRGMRAVGSSRPRDGETSI